MIKFNNVHFAYDKTPVLENFSLEIKKGDRICLFGSSGCGKTTVSRLMLGLEKQQKGKIISDKNLKPSVVFQENRLLPFKTAFQNVALFATNENNAAYHLTALGLKDYFGSYPSELSGGMKRRVAIARALSCDFDYIILDEAFTGLDNENIISAADHIMKTIGDRPLIMITHSKYEAGLLKADIIEM